MIYELLTAGFLDEILAPVHLAGSFARRREVMNFGAMAAGPAYRHPFRPQVARRAVGASGIPARRPLKSGYDTNANHVMAGTAPGKIAGLDPMGVRIIAARGANGVPPEFQRHGLGEPFPLSPHDARAAMDHRVEAGDDDCWFR